MQNAYLLAIAQDKTFVHPNVFKSILCLFLHSHNEICCEYLLDWFQSPVTIFFLIILFDNQLKQNKNNIINIV